MTTFTFGRALVVAIVVGASGTFFDPVLSAQSPPPVERTIAPEGSTNALYRAIQAVASATVSAAEHVYHAIVGGNDRDDVLKGLKEGRTVAVAPNETARPQDSPTAVRPERERGEATEGTVTHIDRGRKRLHVRLDTGATEVLQIEPQAAPDVVVSYLDAEGRRTSILCRKVS